MPTRLEAAHAALIFAIITAVFVLSAVALHWAMLFPAAMSGLFAFKAYTDSTRDSY